MIYRVAVGWTSHRPLRPDEHISGVEVEAANEIEAQLVACQIVGCRPSCEMPTSSRVLPDEV